MRHILLAVLIGAGLLLPLSSQAATSSDDSWLDSAAQHLSDIYHNGTPDVFVTGYTWHDPHTYTAAKLATLNSHGWGLGWGKHMVDAQGNDEMVYGLLFSDSHRNAEPVVGYAKQWRWYPFGGQFKLGAGYTAGITSRADIMHNIPFPIVLPMASIGYGDLTLYGTFLPRFNGSPNNGNVAFFFFRYAY